LAARGKRNGPDRDGTYRRSGVDIDAGHEAVRLMKDAVRSTWGEHVLGQYGGFAGLSRIPGAESSDTVLAVTIDSVGTKVKIGSMCGRFDTVGADLVNHCVNDLLVQRARPLLFADYYASAALNPASVAQAVGGMAEACRKVGCSLVAGETAEMPGVYLDGEIDLAGCMIGTARESVLAAVEPVEPGDVIVGIPSNGLHTNGFSLARHLFFDVAGMTVESSVPELGTTLGEELLRIHREYLTVLGPLIDDPRVHALAHITGGGLIDNLVRVLPGGCRASIDTSAWQPPPVFKLLVKIGDLASTEAYRVLNMGIGLALVCSPSQLESVLSALSELSQRPPVIGAIGAGDPGVDLA
jgi:phosphoribosylformylglycinamidine cyclo-ligase